MTTLHIFAKLEQNNQRCKCDNVRNNNTIPIGPPLPSRSPEKNNITPKCLAQLVLLTVFGLINNR